MEKKNESTRSRVSKHTSYKGHHRVRGSGDGTPSCQCCDFTPTRAFSNTTELARPRTCNCHTADGTRRSSGMSRRSGMGRTPGMGRRSP